MICQKCWNDAFKKSYLTEGCQSEIYQQLNFIKRKDNPCTPEEQAGEYWDDEKNGHKEYNIWDI